MAKFRCDRFPEGTWPIRTHAGMVNFVDGYAELENSDPRVEGLRDLPRDFEVSRVDQEPPSDPPATPQRAESKTDRVRAWAKAQKLSVRDTGRISPTIYKAYKDAGLE